jgi:hypothetical protein
MDRHTLRWDGTWPVGDEDYPNLTGQETGTTFALARDAGLDWRHGDVIIQLGR